VDIHDASGPFVLTLAEPWSSSWHLEGLPDGAAAVHVTVDGYRNGWLVDANGDLSLRLARHGVPWPQRLLLVSLMTVGVAALAVAIRALRWRSRAGRPSAA